MNTILQKQDNGILYLIFNRLDKHNAFNEQMLAELAQAIYLGIDMPDVKALVLMANGRFFSAGADLASMEAIAQASPAENQSQAKQLADVLWLWYRCPKPTMSIVQGDVFGGGLGFIAASDIALSAEDVKYCFSEAKLGLIPAIISPYVVEAMGKKTCQRLFLSAETFDAQAALNYGLIQAIYPSSKLYQEASAYCQHWLKHPASTLKEIKDWLYPLAAEKITETLMDSCAQKLADIRSQEPAKTLLLEFLKHKKGT